MSDDCAKQKDGVEELSKDQGAIEDAAAEEKLLATRRRIIMGAASTVPWIVTFGRKEALAADEYVCQSLGDMQVTLPPAGGTVTCTCVVLGAPPGEGGNTCKPPEDDGSGG